MGSRRRMASAAVSPRRPRCHSDRAKRNCSTLGCATRRGYRGTSPARQPRRHPRRVRLGYRSGMEIDDRARLVRALEGRGMDYELFPCDPALADTAQFCAAYGFEPGDSANTIIVVGKSEPRRYAACLALATHRLDVNRAVRDRIGTRKASFASADETRELTGMEIGGVTPFGLPAGLPVWVDSAVMARPRIIVGGGSRNWKVIASPAILLTLPNVAVVDGLATLAGEPRT